MIPINNTLWSANHPRNFWQCQMDFPDEAWWEAIERALPILGLPNSIKDIDTLLAFTLGETQFGPDCHKLKFVRRVYYEIKPFIPRKLNYFLRRIFQGSEIKDHHLKWPVEIRYAQFQRDVLQQIMQIMGIPEIKFKSFWPEAKQFAFVLTHDVETSDGQKYVSVLADLEESLGFRSSFNFVPERYKIDCGLLRDLRKRGFEIGLHGLKHDGKLFSSYSVFSKRASKINRYLREFEAVGFRSPLTHRNPEWMQELEIEYDLSFFDTDPYEPMPGGVMSIWPYQIGRFLELPYTLPQDGTLFNVFGENNPDIWLKKLDFLAQYHGMVLMLVHPDYSSTGTAFQCYKRMLRNVQQRGGYWHALPRDVANWWKRRLTVVNEFDSKQFPFSLATLEQEALQIKNQPLN